MKIFRAPYQTLLNWFAAKSITSGSVQERAFTHFKSLSGKTTGTVMDHIDRTLLDLGYSGTTRDKLNSFFTVKMSTASVEAAETAFWADTSTSFTAGAGLLAEDGSNLLAEDGSSLLPE